MGGIKEDLYYNPELFDEKPYLFRDYIVSDRHFKELSDFYTQNYHDDSLKNIDFEKLFYYGKDTNNSYKIDLYFATAEVWEMMLGCDKQRATELSAGYYDTFESIGLSDDELDIVRNKFKADFNQLYINVVINIIQNNQNAKIRFEYDIQNKKGSNFVYDI